MWTTNKFEAVGLQIFGNASGMVSSQVLTWCHIYYLVIKVKEFEIIKEVKRNDSLWRFACGDVSKLCFPKCLYASSKLSELICSFPLSFYLLKFPKRPPRAYLIIVIFGTPTYFLGLKKYAKKVRKFATKFASRQNSVNQYLEYKFTFFMSTA